MYTFFMSISNNNYKQYLDSIHKRNITPDEIIIDTIKEGTGKELVSKKRIIIGETNEVYDITLDDRHVILRISKGEFPNFL